VVAKLVRYLAGCARGIQRVGDDASANGEIHGLLRRMRVDRLSIPQCCEHDLAEH
jgi:hypothetical protein